MADTRDGGAEPEEVYDANVADELNHPANKNRKDAIMRNVGFMKQWAKEGK